MSAQLVSLLAVARAAAQGAPRDNTRMNPDKDLASNVLSDAGLVMKAPSLKMIVYLFVGMEHTALLV